MKGALPNPQATILLLGYVAMTRHVYPRKIPNSNYEKKIKMGRMNENSAKAMPLLYSH